MPAYWVDAFTALMIAFRRRMSQALCLRPNAWGAPGTGGTSPEAQRGSAVVEFTFLAVLLMVPVVYFVVTVGQIQGGSFAVVGAADQAAKVFVAHKDPTSARIAAERSVLIALKDYGHSAESASITIECDGKGCLSAGTTVTVTVRLDIALPLVPFGDSLELNAGRVSASASQIVGRYQ